MQSKFWTHISKTKNMFKNVDLAKAQAVAIDAAKLAAKEIVAAFNTPRQEFKTKEFVFLKTDHSA